MTIDGNDFTSKLKLGDRGRIIVSFSVSPGRNITAARAYFDGVAGDSWPITFTSGAQFIRALGYTPSKKGTFYLYVDATDDCGRTGSTGSVRKVTVN